MARKYRRATGVAGSAKVAPVAASAPTNRVPKAGQTPTVPPSRQAASAGGKSTACSGLPVARPLSDRNGGSDFATFLQGLTPEDIWAYPHFARVWIKRPLAVNERRALRGLCHGNVRVFSDGDRLRDAEGQIVRWSKDSRRKGSDGKPLHKKGEAYRVHINFPYQQEVHLICPTPEAIAYLHSRNDRAPSLNDMPATDKKPPLIIYAEIAHELILKDHIELQATFDAFAYCLVQRWPGTFGPRRAKRNRYVSAAGNLVSTGRRWPGNYRTAYTGKASPVTGQPDCFKNEGRYCGALAVRNQGIRSLSDLLDFDFRAYVLKTLRLEYLDMQHLGRWHRNKVEGTKRQKPEPDDIRTARVLMRAYGYDLNGYGTMSVQSFLNQYPFGRGPFVKSVSVEHLLPEAKSALDFGVTLT